MLNINDSWIEVNCPKCQYLLDVKLVDVKLEKKIYCHNCKITIQLKDESASIHTGTKRINDLMNKFEKTLKKLAK